MNAAVSDWRESRARVARHRRADDGARRLSARAFTHSTDGDICGAHCNNCNAPQALDLLAAEVSERIDKPVKIRLHDLSTDRSLITA